MKPGVNDRSYFGAAFTAGGVRVSRSRTWSQTATLGIVDRGGGGLEGDCGDAAGVVLVVSTGRGRPPGRALTKARDPAASCRQGEESRWVWPRLNSFDPCRTPRIGCVNSIAEVAFGGVSLLNVILLSIRWKHHAWYKTGYLQAL